jgi:hypothetical protein
MDFLPAKKHIERVHDELRSTAAHRSTRSYQHLRNATQVGGGSAKQQGAGKLLHPHFVKEDEFALPPLGLLQPLAQGAVTSEMAGVLKLTDRLAAELPAMLAEHKTIVAALERLSEAARRAGRSDVVEFAQKLTLHAQTEELVMYPAALLVGRVVRQSLEEAATAH